jgi:hypothetical protein
MQIPAPLLHLTHGGFYKHFESKEQVVTESVAFGVESMIES